MNSASPSTTSPHPIQFLRRLGPDPHEGGRKTLHLHGCPDIWEATDGSFLVIGKRVTAELVHRLPPTAGCGPDEEIVQVPRNTLVLARYDIPV